MGARRIFPLQMDNSDRPQVEFEAMSVIPLDVKSAVGEEKWRDEGVLNVRHILHISDGDLCQ